MKNRNLLIIFLILVGIYLLSRVFDTKRDRSFQSELIQIDTSRISAIHIDPGGTDQPSFRIEREDHAWIATNGQLSDRARSEAVDALLRNLHLIETKRIVAKQSDKWSDYEVGEGQGTRIEIYVDDEKEEEFIVGRFNFNQQTRTGISYIRLAGQNEVYAVDGFQTLTFGQGYDTYRDKTLIKLSPEQEIQAVRYQSADTTLSLRRSEGGIWARADGQAVDSASMATYLNRLRKLQGTEFADDFDEMEAQDYQAGQLLIETTDPPREFILTLYRDTSRQKPFVLQSSYDPKVFFASDSTGLYRQTFGQFEEFYRE